MGTPMFAVEALKALVERTTHEIVFVVTQPDKPQGRGLRLVSPPVKILANRHNIPVHQPASLKANEQMRMVFASAGLDIVVVVAYGKMIPADWLGLPRFGFVNVHASLLPEFRGASPINRAILAGKTVTGVSIMRIEEEMDAGPVYARVSTPIGEDEDASSLADRLSVLGAEKLLEVLPLIASGALTAEPQDHARATYAPPLRREEGEIDWTMSARAICTMVRGLVPWPCAYTFLDGKMLKILKARWEKAAPGEPPGTMLRQKRGVCIACADGFVIPLELQTEGKRPLSGEAFACGLRSPRAHLGGQGGVDA